MAKKKDLKALIRERMKKTGESYTTARAHIVRKGKPCPSCGGPLSAVLVQEMVDLSEDDFDDLTEGQQADYMAEMYSGSGDNWNSTGREWFCPKCEPHPENDGPAMTGPIEFERYPARSSHDDDDDDI